MNRILIAVAAVLLWTVISFVAGWQVRDNSAETVIAKAETVQEAARADNAEQSRATDHADAQTATKAEQARVDTAAKREATFNTIEDKAERYAQANPDSDSDFCDLDGDGLQAWREANAGTTEARPDHPTGTANPLPARASTTR